MLRREEQQQVAGRLPIGWEVTSDSIAARIAELTGSVELVLLKSTLPPAGASVSQLVANGYVDDWFQHAWTTGRLRCVDLRREQFPERSYARGCV